MLIYAQAPVLTRWLTITPVALVVTLGLLLLMHLLVYMEPPELSQESVSAMPRVVMEPVDPIVPVEERPTMADDPELPPARIVPDPAVEFVPSAGDTGFTYEPPAVIGPTKIATGGQLVAHFKVQPTYPVRAASRGIEGYVVVEFDVTEMGTTDNIRIVYAQPDNIFDREVLRAVQRWRYHPQQVQGEAVRSTAVRERISFSLSQ